MDGTLALLSAALEGPNALAGNMSDLSQFERIVLEALVHGEDPLLTALALQASRALVRDREFTGVGCFVNLSLPADVPLTPKRHFNVGDVHLELERCAHGAAAILFVRDGRMSFLELVVHTGDWPAHPVLNSIRYLSPSGLREERDLAEFRRQAEFA